MPKKQRKFTDDGWAVWVDGDDTSTVYINGWINPKGNSYVDLSIRIRGVKASRVLSVYVPFPLSDDEIDKRVREAAAFVNLTEEQLMKSPFELSGGQKRRVAIAGVLAMKPKVLILDEPTAGLDPKGRDEILDQIAYLQKEGNLTVILVSHSMEDIAKYVDRIVVMNKRNKM